MQRRDIQYSARKLSLGFANVDRLELSINCCLKRRNLIARNEHNTFSHVSSGSRGIDKPRPIDIESAPCLLCTQDEHTKHRHTSNTNGAQKRIVCLHCLFQLREILFDV